MDHDSIPDSMAIDPNHEVVEMKKQKDKDIMKHDITTDDMIRYDVMHPRWGRAMFEICPVFRYGKMRKLYIYRRSQPIHECFIMDIDARFMNVTCFDITSWTHKTEHPMIWRHPWCAEHGCVSFWVYAPLDTDRIRFEPHFASDLTIRFEKESDMP